jgi:hypothetical protein
MQKISDWNSVPDGGIVVEDTYAEVYEMFTREGERWIRQIGWEMPPGRSKVLPEVTERLVNFQPNAFMDQPWYYLDEANSEDYAHTAAKSD